MNLFGVLRQRWAADTALEAALPADRVYVGTAPEPTIPFAVLTKRSDRPTESMNDGTSLNAVGVRIEVFDDGYDSATAIAELIRAAFDRTEFDLTGGDKVVNMRRHNATERQADDGLWHLSLDFDCTVYLEKPKLAAHLGEMVENLAGVLELPPGDVSIKATTTDGMGFVGREEGAAASAVMLVAVDR